MNGKRLPSLIDSNQTKRVNRTRSPVPTLGVYVFLIGLFACTGAVAQNPVILPIGIIEYYGLRTVSQDTVSQVLGLAAGDTLVINTGNEQRDIAERLEEIPGVVQARVHIVCCTEDKRRMHASPAYTLLCRVDGLSVEEIAETLRRGAKEAVIARIVESGQTR